MNNLEMDNRYHSLFDHKQLSKLLDKMGHNKMLLKKWPSARCRFEINKMMRKYRDRAHGKENIPIIYIPKPLPIKEEVIDKEYIKWQSEIGMLFYTLGMLINDRTKTATEVSRFTLLELE